MSDFIQVMGGDFPKGITLELEKDYFVFRTGFFKKEKVDLLRKVNPYKRKNKENKFSSYFEEEDLF